MRIKAARFSLGALLALACVQLASGYVYITNSTGHPIVRAAGAVPLQIMVDNAAVLSDGATRATSIQAAAQAWNAQIASVQFTTSISSPASGGQLNGSNDVFFSADVYGTSWGSGTLAVTLTWYNDTTSLSSESDLLLNPNYTWDSYRGALQSSVDIRRVVLHELGHMLGLNHPNQSGQTVQAIMNSSISSIDSLQPDDIVGAQLLYGAPGGSVAPSVTGQPQPQSIYIGFSTTFNVTATGSGPMVYRWQIYLPAYAAWANKYDDIFYSGTGSPTLTILGGNSVYGANSSLDGTLYRCVVTNGGGSATSNSALLRVTAAPPVIQFQPVPQTVFVTQTAQFTISADAYGPVSYLWQRLSVGSAVWQDLADGGAYSFTHDRFLYVVATVGMNGDQFRCIVTNPGGSVTSTPALLTVDPGVAPAITLNPQSQTVLEGASVTFSAAASGVPAPGLQWQKDNVNIPGASSASFTISSVAAEDAGVYRLVATNVAGTVTSTAAILTVGGPVVTSLSPNRVVVTTGQTLSLSVTATGTGPVSYQWQRNGLPIAGATASNLSVSNIGLMQGGWYRVILTDSTGTRRSATIFVIVTSLTRVRAWGTDDYPTLKAVPAGLNDVVSVAAGMRHVLALRADGHVVAWGPGTEGQVDVPANLTNAVAIAAGSAYSFVLKGDGTVISFGLQESSNVITVPAGLRNVVAISASGSNAMALKSDGTVVCWGNPIFGSPAAPAGLSGVVSIAANDRSSIALKSDGTIVQWGSDTGPPAGLTSIVGIAGGTNHSLALKSDGTLVAWGYSGYGLDTPPVTPSGYQAMATNSALSFGLTNAGTLNVWGYAGPNSYLLAPPPDLDHVVAIGAGVYYVALAVVDARLDVAPSITAQPLGVTSTEGQSATFTVSAVGGTAALTYQWRHNGSAIAGATSTSLVLPNLALGDAGNYDVLITNYLGSVVSNSAVLTINPLPVVSVSSLVRNVLVDGQSLNLAVTATGTGTLSYQWIHNGFPIDGATGTSFSVASPTFRDSGWYVVVVTDIYGIRRSAPMFVSVSPATTALKGWGFDYSGETHPPVGLDGALAISASNNSSALALRRDGTVASWGDSFAFQLQVPAGLSEVVAVSAGNVHALALKSDSTVVGWGNGTAGGAAVPPGLNQVVAVAAGNGFSVVLKSDGTLVTWGTGGGVPAGVNHVAAIAAGDSHVVALKDDGTVVSWASYNVGQTNVPANLSGVVAIAAGGYHSLALKNDGTVVAWGNSTTGATAVPAGLGDVVAISGGETHSLALKNDGTVVGWGSNNYGQAVEPAGIGKVLAISAGSFFNLVMYDSASPSAPAISAQPTNQSVSAGAAASFSVVVSGNPIPSLQWQKLSVGSNTWTNLIEGGGYTGVSTPNLTLAVASPNNTGTQFRCVALNSLGSAISNLGLLTVAFSPAYLKLAAGRYHSLHLDNSFQLSVTGANSYGQLGTGSTTPINASQLLTLSGLKISDVVAGAQHSFFLTTANELWAMGINDHGQLNDGTTNTEFVPTRITTSVVGIAASVVHSAFLKNDGTLWTVGGNDEGQLGNGNTIEQHTAVQIATNVVDLAVGNRQTLFVKSDGTLWGTGDLYNNGSLSSSPIQIATGVKTVAAGAYHCVILKTDGTLWTLGFNAFGQLGDGDAVTATAPVQIASGVKAIAAGYFHTAFIKADNSLWMCGFNSFGQLGDGTTSQRSIPFQLATNVATVSASESYTLFTKLDGSLWGTGLNGNGQFGNGLLTTVTVPVQISGGSVTSPGLVTNLVAAVNGAADRLNLTWQPVANSTSYEIWRSTADVFGSATKIAQNVRWAFYQDVSGSPYVTYYYWVTAVNSTDTSGSSVSTSGVFGPATAPVFNVEPSSASVAESGNVAFTAAANGFPVPFMSWQRMRAGTSSWLYLTNAGNYSGAHENTLVVNATTLDMNGDQFRAVAINSVATVFGNPVILTVISASSPVAGDMNGDRGSDIIWENTVTGDRGFYLMNGTGFSSWVDLGYVPTDWRITGTGDFNGDNKTDLVWENTTTGERFVWLMNGTTFSSGVSLGVVPTEWRIAAVADFNGDGKPDLLWENTATGDRGFWLMNGTSFAAWIDLGIVSTDWHIAGAGDFNGDHKPDVVWENKVTGDRCFWLMNGTSFSSLVDFGYVSNDWQIAGVGDFNGDGLGDLLWQNSASGLRYIWLMNGSAITSAVSLGTVSTDWRIAN